MLSGGTGGAKLARGLYEVCGAELTVVANPGDDIEIYGAYVSPDPDIATYWLADRIDERGWGIDGDSFNVMEMLRELGTDVWFNLGDRDLALCLERRRMLDDGATLSQAHAALTAALGVDARVIPASDDPVRTMIRSGERRLTVQDFLIIERGAPPIDGVEFVGAEVARAAPAAIEAIDGAEAIIIGPSNPVLSIGPILAIGAIRRALEDAAAPIVAVSPIVAGSVLKGPTAAFLAWAGVSVDAAGIAAHYGDLIDALVADAPVAGVTSLQCDTWMGSATARREVAVRTLELARALAAD
ncbi:MAG: 2-phospho-L-lactate transferase [Solirubrobacteraceae bacterium]